MVRLRILGIVSALLASAVLVLPLSTVATAKPKQEKTKILMDTPEPGGPAGSTVVLSGQLVKVKLAAPLPRKMLAISARVGRSGDWSPVGEVKTDAEGRFSVEVSPIKSTSYRFTFRKTKKLKGKKGFVRVVPSQSIEVKTWGPGTVDAGEEVWLAGQASEGLAGEPLWLTQFVQDSWTRVGSGVVAADGTFRIATTTAQGGVDQRFRVEAPASDRVAGAVSNERSFVVYEWYPLTSMPPAEDQAQDLKTLNVVAKPARVDGVDYPSSWMSAYYAETFTDPFERGQVAFKPLTRCNGLEAVMGVQADVGSAGAWQFEVFIDGVQYNYGYIGKGEAKPLSLNLTAITRLRLVNVRDTSASGEVDAVWAGGRIKCAGQP